MALNPQYIVAINLQEYLVDKDTGLPLANGYIQFWEDDSRTTPKTVYELTGAPPNYTYTALPNPVNLSAVGVPVDANGNQTHIYYYPYDTEGNIQLYYISVYNSSGVLQYTLQAWPNITPEDSPEDLNNNVSNQISNSQFSQVLFVPAQGLVISFSEALEAVPYQIAPGWELIITSTGAGTVTVQQVALEGALNIPTNPPFTLSFQPTGSMITQLILRQTLSNNPDIWSTTTGGPGYISGIMLVSSLDGQPHTLTMQYDQSNGNLSPQIIVTGSTLTTGYQLLNNTVLLNSGSNTDTGATGAIYIDIVLPTIGYYSLTSIQVCGTNSDDTIVQYEQEPVNRQLDHLYHYYQPQIFFKPIKSYLCGWDFPLNPAQFNGTSVSASSNASQYLWDQTIGWQSVVSSLSANRYSSGGAATGSLELTVANTCQIAIVQYLTTPEIIDLLNNRLSSNIILSSNQASISGTISLWYTTGGTAPNINTSGLSLISGLNTNGKPTTFNGTWVEIPRSNYGDAIFTTSTSTSLNSLQNFGFNGWQLPSTVDISTVTYFAIVVGFQSITAANSIVIQSCSLVAGDIATIPAPQTANEVLTDCQYYYEKSYDYNILPGTAVRTGMLANAANAVTDSTQVRVFQANFTITFKSPKVTIPVYSTSGFNGVTFYSVSLSNTPDNYILHYNATDVARTFSADFTLGSSGLNAISFVTQNQSTTYIGTPYGSVSSSQSFQYTIDTRIGVY